MTGSSTGAWELAHELAKRPPLTLRYTRMLFTQDLKRPRRPGSRACAKSRGVDVEVPMFHRTNRWELHHLPARPNEFMSKDVAGNFTR
jgi:hypothetical protein